MRHIFTNNPGAKLVSLVLAALLWAVIRRSQIAEPMPQPAEGKAAAGNFEIRVNGK